MLNLLWLIIAFSVLPRTFSATAFLGIWVSLILIDVFLTIVGGSWIRYKFITKTISHTVKEVKEVKENGNR